MAKIGRDSGASNGAENGSPLPVDQSGLLNFVTEPQIGGVAIRTLLPRARVARTDRATTSVTLNGTAWANVDTAMDLTLQMSAGQYAVLGVSGLWGNENVSGDLDVATIVSGSPVSYISGGTGQTTDRGILAWGGENAVFTHFGSVVSYLAILGDVSSGSVTFRLRGKTSIASNKILYSTSLIRMSFFGWVLG